MPVRLIRGGSRAAAGVVASRSDTFGGSVSGSAGEMGTDASWGRAEADEARGAGGLAWALREGARGEGGEPA
eukprot:277607-Pleurochrysis_carterae.AAC.1